MKTILDKGRALLALSLCILSALALCMQFPEPELSAAARDSGILNIMENLRLSLDGTAVLSSFVAAALYFLWRHNRRESQRRYVLLPVCCCLMALIWLMARGFEIDNTLQSLTSGDRGDGAAGGQKQYFLLHGVPPAFLVCAPIIPPGSGGVNKKKYWPME